MFELSVACKYLIPHRRQLSVSIISLVSMLVIGLVVWLILVFFSVKDGLENGWINKIVALTAPIRITPTDEYYKSYYYLIDSLSSNSSYKNKNIQEKLHSIATDPYDPDNDEELPASWPSPLLNEFLSLKDLVKEAYESAKYPGATVSDFETAAAHLHLTLLRKGLHSDIDPDETQVAQQYLEHSTYIGSFDDDNPTLSAMLLPPTIRDWENLKEMARQAYVTETISSELAALPSSDKRSILLKDHPKFGHGVLVPQSFKEAGVLIGDRGYVSYPSLTSSTVQEQRIPIYIAGFFDPGIMPVSSKYVLANDELISAIRNSIDSEDALMSNGISVRFAHLSDAPQIKAHILQEMEKRKITSYWHVETYREYPFAKDLIQQLQSEKNLFSIISLIIIIVACSNIISMLIILVNDKKLEIGILRSMGASSLSIATIFGLCGITMGAVGSTIGTFAALLTLRYINEIVFFMTTIQGHDLFNPLFYGSVLPSEVSMDSLLLVIAATACISLLAGVVPAIKASMLRPSAILRSE